MKASPFLRSAVAASILTLCALASFAQAAPERRSALLIANGDYLHFGKLPNPLPEARALRSALEKLGFGVVLVENGDRETMLDAIAEFEARLREQKGLAFFHYGGHAVQVSGKNYLIPAQAEIPDERRVATRAVDLDEVMGSLIAAGSETSIVVLDACRNNPLPASSGRSASRGLEVLGTKPRNSVVVFAAEANTEAQDGVFTPALVKYLQTPGLSLSEVLQKVRREVYDRTGGKQTPGEYNQLFTPVYLAGKVEAGAASSGGTGGAAGAGGSGGQASGGSGASAGAQTIPGSAASVAELVASADQEGAEIWLDGKLLGIAPNLFSSLPVGRELLVEAKKGAWSAAERVTLSPKETREIYFRLQLGKGNLFFLLSNASVYKLKLDGADFGSLSVAGLAKDIGAGEREAELRGEGMYWKGRVAVKPGETTALKVQPWEVGTFLVDLPSDTEFSLVQVLPTDSSSGLVVWRGKGSRRMELLPTGRYSFEAWGPGYESYRETIALGKGEERKVEAWTKGALSIETIPSNAQIFVNGVERGRSPLLIKDAPVGLTTLSAKSQGYEDASQVRLVEAGKNVVVSLALTKAQAAFKDLFFDPATKHSAVVLSNNNKTAYNQSLYWCVFGDRGFDKGKWYFEMKIDALAGSTDLFIGVCQKPFRDYNMHSQKNSWVYQCGTSTLYSGGESKSYGEACVAGDIIGVSLDCGQGTVSFSRNGKDFGIAYRGLSGELFPVVQLSGTKVSIVSLRQLSN